MLRLTIGVFLSSFSLALMAPPPCSAAKAKSSSASKRKTGSKSTSRPDGDGAAPERTRTTSDTSEDAEGKGPRESDSGTATLPISGVTDASPVGEAQGDSVRRGMFVEGDLGLFSTLGGRWTNRADLPGRPISNTAPHLGIVVGYDVSHSASYSFSVGARFAAAFNGGSGRVSAEDVAACRSADCPATTKSADYSIMEAGLELGLALMLADRVALTVKLDGGAGIVDPNPTLVATLPGAGGASLAPLFGTGLGLEYFTLLNDFSVGLKLRFLGALAPKSGGGSEFIPGLALTFPLKYTF